MLPEAEKAAFEFMDLIRDYCTRLEIAGSIRRRVDIRPVKDIEFVAVPKFEKSTNAQTLLFGPPPGQEYNILDARLKELLALKAIRLDRRSSDGRAAPFSERYYRLTYSCYRMDADYPVDLFTVLPPADWGIIMTLRTGPAEFSHQIVTEALRREMKVRDGQLFKRYWSMGDPPTPYYKKIDCPAEKDFFKGLGIPYLTAEERERITVADLEKQWGHPIYPKEFKPEVLSGVHPGEI